mgnify:CR=1 FL=1
MDTNVNTVARLSNILLGQTLYQEKFAELADISARQVQNLCAKNTNVSIEVYHKIVTALMLPLGSLLTFIEVPPKKKRRC